MQAEQLFHYAKNIPELFPWDRSEWFARDNCSKKNISYDFAQSRNLILVLTLYSAIFVRAGKDPYFFLVFYYFIIPESVFGLIF